MNNDEITMQDIPKVDKKLVKPKGNGNGITTFKKGKVEIAAEHPKMIQTLRNMGYQEV